jgi:hypothetical protein
LEIPQNTTKFEFVMKGKIVVRAGDVKADAAMFQLGLASPAE